MSVIVHIKDSESIKERSSDCCCCNDHRRKVVMTRCRSNASRVLKKLSTFSGENSLVYLTNSVSCANVKKKTGGTFFVKGVSICGIGVSSGHTYSVASSAFLCKEKCAGDPGVKIARAILAPGATQGPSTTSDQKRPKTKGKIGVHCRIESPNRCPEVVIPFVQATSRASRDDCSGHAQDRVDSLHKDRGIFFWLGNKKIPKLRFDFNSRNTNRHVFGKLASKLVPGF